MPRKASQKIDPIELARRTANEQARLDAYNRRVETANAANGPAKPGRIVSKPRPLARPPFNPEAGRYRLARMPGGRLVYDRMPHDAGQVFGSRLECPQCGAPMLSYTGRGRYYCSMRRVSVTGVGCGRYSYGPCNPSETAYSDAERVDIEADDSLPIFPR